MLKLSDQPFVYYPPKFHPVLTPLGRLYNKYLYMSNAEHRITGVKNFQTEDIGRLRRDRNNHLLFIYNHPSHSDSQIVLESLRQMRISTLYLASYDLFFRRTAFEKWAMQLAGAFSVDREAFNAQPMNQAVKTLTDSRHALTVFAEGRPYLQNELVTKFHSGAVFMGLQAQRKLKKAGGKGKVFLIPGGIKVTHTEDCSKKVLEMLYGLSKEMGMDVRNIPDNITLLEKTAVELMQKALESRGYGKAEGSSYSSMQESGAGAIIESLEKSMGITPDREQSLWERTVVIRTRIHAVMLNPEKNAGKLPEARRWADHVLIAMKILSYPPGYVREKPTLDRFGETVERLMEDKLTYAIPPYSRRAALVKYGDPVDLSGYISGRKIETEIVEKITDSAKNQVQNLVNELSAEHDYPGLKVRIR